jgi:integrase
MQGVATNDGIKTALRERYLLDVFGKKMRPGTDLRRHLIRHTNAYRRQVNASHICTFVGQPRGRHTRSAREVKDSHARMWSDHFHHQSRIRLGSFVVLSDCLGDRWYLMIPKVSFTFDPLMRVASHRRGLPNRSVGGTPPPFFQKLPHHSSGRPSGLVQPRNVDNAGTATREEVEAWWVSRAHLSPATRHNDLANLRTFYKWAKRWEHRDDDPTTRIDSPHVNPGLPRPMSRADLHRALDSRPPHLRRATCLGAYAGLRVSEAARLDWSDVDLESQTILVMHSKGDKSRRVPMSAVLLSELLPVTGGNVVMAGGAPYAPDSLTRRMHLAFRGLGITATFHTLRHRYGTIAYKATGDIFAVSRLLGHANINTSAIYIAANDDTAALIANAVSA